MAHYHGMKPTFAHIFALIYFCAAGLGVAAEPARSFTIGGESFAEADIVDARAQPDLDGMASILVTLEPKASARLAVITKRYLRKVMPLQLNGTTLTEPLVLEPIIAGAFQISGRFSVPEAEALALKISGKPPLPDSLEE